MLHSVAWQPNMHCPFDDAEKAESKAVDPQMNTPYSRTLMVEFALSIVDLTVCWRVKGLQLRVFIEISDGPNS